MRFHERLFQLHVILGHNDTSNLWEPEGWNSIKISLKAATEKARGPASLNSLQYVTNGKYMSDIKFGRLGLTDKSQEKWIHDYVTYPERKDWFFHSIELWAPGRTTCGNQNLAPDIYLGIINEDYLKQGGKLAFNPYLILAGAIDKGEEFKKTIEDLATLIAQQTQATLAITKVISWGRPTGPSSFTDAIGDLLVSSVFKPGHRSADGPLIDQIDDYWK